jgi:hypothetical protein
VGGDCGDGYQCLPTFFSTQGSCNPTGDNAAGETCDEHVPGTDCEAGSTCSGESCHELCDYWSGNSECPDGAPCGPDGVCTTAFEDEAQPGEECELGTGWFCASDGARYAGYCVNIAGIPTCHTVCRTQSDDCDTGETCEPLYSDAPYGVCM